MLKTLMVAAAHLFSVAWTVAPHIVYAQSCDSQIGWLLVAAGTADDTARVKFVLTSNNWAHGGAYAEGYLDLHPELGPLYGGGLYWVRAKKASPCDDLDEVGIPGAICAAPPPLSVPETVELLVNSQIVVLYFPVSKKSIKFVPNCENGLFYGFEQAPLKPGTSPQSLISISFFVSG